MLVQLREAMVMAGNQTDINREEGNQKVSNSYSIECSVIILLMNNGI
jgi:hypothetical protein